MSMGPQRITFITGTDTNVGKTVLTAMLLRHLLANGVRAVALKPICSGDRNDAQIFHRILNGRLSLDDINPYFFPKPVAPFVEARRLRREIRMSHLLRHIKRVSRDFEHLLIEGAGGVMVPLGENFAIRDLISSMQCRVIVIGRNQLGAINHVRLTVEALRASNVDNVTVVLMKNRHGDVASQTNVAVMRELLMPVKVIELPDLGLKPTENHVLEKKCKKVKKTLARILNADIFTHRSLRRTGKTVEKSVDSLRGRK